MCQLQVSVACVQTKEGLIQLDPTSAEEAPAAAPATFDCSFNPSCTPPTSLLSCSSVGCYTGHGMRDAMDVCTAASLNVDKAIKGFVREAMERGA